MNWYVVQTKPKKEEDAKSYLSTKGVEVFNPLIETFVPKWTNEQRIKDSLPELYFCKV